MAVAALGALLNSRLQSVAGPGVSADAMLFPRGSTRSLTHQESPIVEA